MINVHDAAKLTDSGACHKGIILPVDIGNPAVTFLNGIFNEFANTGFIVGKNSRDAAEHMVDGNTGNVTADQRTDSGRVVICTDDAQSGDVPVCAVFKLGEIIRICFLINEGHIVTSRFSFFLNRFNNQDD